MLLKSEDPPRRIRLRGAVLAALLLHVFAAWAWTGFGQRIVLPESSALAVMLQPNAVTAHAPKPMIDGKSSSEQRKIQRPHIAPKLLTQPATQSTETSPKVVPKVAAPAPAVEPVLDTKAVVPVAAPVAGNSKSKDVAVAQTEAKVTPAQYRAAHLKNPEPVMPYISRKNGESGTVGLWVKVSAKGEPLAVRVEKSSGFARLDNVAVQTVKEQWRFVPAKQGDTPIESEVAFNIPFILKDAD